MGGVRERHEWQTARFTGNTTCVRCGLLPLDTDDFESPCDQALMRTDKDTGEGR